MYEYVGTGRTFWVPWSCRPWSDSEGWRSAQVGGSVGGSGSTDDGYGYGARGAGDL